MFQRQLWRIFFNSYTSISIQASGLIPNSFLFTQPLLDLHPKPSSSYPGLGLCDEALTDPRLPIKYLKSARHIPTLGHLLGQKRNRILQNEISGLEASDTGRSEDPGLGRSEKPSNVVFGEQDLSVVGYHRVECVPGFVDGVLERSP